MGNRIWPPVAAFLLLAVLSLTPSPGAHAADAPAYLALGDSLAFGVGATNPAAEGYVGLTHFELQQSERYAETDLELINVSVPGATSSELLEPDGQVDEAISEIEERLTDNPDAPVEIISLDVGGNDLLALAEPDSPCIEGTTTEACLDALGEMLSTLQANLREMLVRLRDAAPDAEIYVIDLYNPYSGTGEVQEIVANVAVQQVNGVISAASADPDLDVHLVSVFELFEGRAAQWIASDGIHPNDDGYRVMSAALLASINNQQLVLPSDLAASPSPGATGDALAIGGSDDGVDQLVVLILAVVAFLAGAIVSAAYFVTRGRGRL